VSGAALVGILLLSVTSSASAQKITLGVLAGASLTDDYRNDGPEANAVKILCRHSTLQSPSRRIKMFKGLADVSHDFTVAPD
jgi:hypothetical protein